MKFSAAAFRPFLAITLTHKDAVALATRLSKLTAARPWSISETDTVHEEQLRVIWPGKFKGGRADLEKAAGLIRASGFESARVSSL